MILSDDQKRWVVFGVALNKVLVAEIRPFVEQEIQREYGNLQAKHNIHTQSYTGRLRRHAVAFKYENINGNDTLPKKPGRKYDILTFDYRVTSHIDFAKLYVENHMAKFNAFDERCDASALLALLGKVPVFPAVVQTAAGNVRQARNSWAHCEFGKWDQIGFQQSFDKMKQLVKQLGLPIAAKDTLLKELEDWEKKGNDKGYNRKSFLFSAKLGLSFLLRPFAFDIQSLHSSPRAIFLVAKLLRQLRRSVLQCYRSNFQRLLHFSRPRTWLFNP